MEEEVVKYIHETLPIPDVLSRRNILCVLPHPDDGEIGAGATIAKLKSLGAKVRYILVTDGSAGIREKSREETREIRKSEQEAAAKMLNIDSVDYLNYPDGGDYNIEDVKRDLTKYFKKFEPDLIITVDPFLPYECHPDHKICGLAAAQTLLFQYDSSVPLAFFFTAYPNQFICVSEEELQKKFSAIMAHKSQINEEIIRIYKGYFEMKAKIYGKKIGCEYAEGFKVLMPFMLHAFEEALWI